MSSFGRKKRNAEDNEDFPDNINVREMFRVYETRGEIPEEGEIVYINMKTVVEFHRELVEIQ